MSDPQKKRVRPSLRPFQEKAIEYLKRTKWDGVQRIFISVPIGCGKSAITAFNTSSTEKSR